MNIEEDDDLSFPRKLNGADKWILTRLNDVIKDVTINLNKYEIGLAAARLYDFTWSEFCDWYIEMSKPLLYGGSKKDHSHAVAMLTHVLTVLLKLLHPFIPFVTEEIYSKYAPKGSVLMVSDWPSYNKKTVFRKEERNFEALRATVVAVRNMRAEMNVPPAKKFEAFVIARDPAFVTAVSGLLERLAGISAVHLIEQKSEVTGAVASVVTDMAEILVPMGELIDIDKERERLGRELEQARADADRLGKLLANAAFVAKAPQKLVESEREKLARADEKVKILTEKLAALGE